MDERSVEGHMQDDDAAAAMVLPDDEGMPTPRALEQMTDAEELPSGDRSSNDA